MIPLAFAIGLLLGAAVACLWLGGLLRGRAEAEAAAYSDGFRDGVRDAQWNANVSARWSRD